ncbi:MAG: maltose alpha-D-glucosyltransferase [Anaerolineae bacterium]
MSALIQKSGVATGELMLMDDPLWYKDAIIYELHVRAFSDSNADGMGDFRGLTQKLDYLQSLGITAIWLLPFFPSPWRDDGYDIADYSDVHPAYGTVRDVKQLVREAHRRGLRVIGELVCNHTSDQHAWFQRARRAAPGSPLRDFYVWSDDPTKYKDARIIFTDTETSNWTWDPVAQAYYWHRFFHHQPDLNFDNPRVCQAIMAAMEQWLDIGLDGLRLDAIPYLFEREGTSCENLPETHAFLKELRRHVDRKYRNRVFLAEANQWPEDTIPYFGDGDECHMAFHFPLMPRLYMALRTEDRFPILDILAQTPPIPETAQWATFLRNHDELTLEMVTEEERDYMWRVYARDPRMRINLGIRRRLAPLLDNDRRRIELLNGLLFALPGTPVLYYGDEIGMGDNIYLGDRDGVRTPMQWSADRNAGFSQASSQRLYLPVIGDGEYSYETVNVEVQSGNPNSLLSWMQRLIRLRKRYKAFGRGTITFLHPDNRKALAFVRRHEGETILVVANLSRDAQPVELDLGEHAGWTLTEMLGGAAFPPITSAPYLVTLAPYGFYWFALQPPADADLAERAAPPALIPTLPLTDVEDLFEGPGRDALLDAAPGYLKRIGVVPAAEPIRSARLLDVVPLASRGREFSVTLVELETGAGDVSVWLLPLTVLSGAEANQLVGAYAPSIIARLRPTGNETRIVVDAFGDPLFAAALVDLAAGRRSAKGGRGSVAGSLARGRVRGAGGLTPETADVCMDPAGVSTTWPGGRLRVFRQLAPGPRSGLEVQAFLTEHEFPHVVPLTGALHYQPERGDAIALAMLQGAPPEGTNGWDWALSEVDDYLGRMVAATTTPAAQPLTTAALLTLAESAPSAEAENAIGQALAHARLLGQRTGELHRALASGADDKAFAPEPFTGFYQRSVYQETRSLTRRVMQALRRRMEHLPRDARPAAQDVLGQENALLERFHGIIEGKITAARIRCDGDYDLSDVITTGHDFVTLDLGGDITRPLSERRLKLSPLRDVAGMLASLHTAAYTALADRVRRGLVGAADFAAAEAWTRFWAAWVSASFLKGYLDAVGPAHLLPSSPHLVQVLDVLRLRKAIHDLGGAVETDAGRVLMPLTQVLQMLE